MQRLKTAALVLALLVAAAVPASLRVIDPALTAERAIEVAARTALAEVGDIVLHGDTKRARELAASYYTGQPPETPIPFVYEGRDAPHLVALHERFDLDAVVAGDGGEYAAMLRLAAWIGTRFEHGTDEVPGGRQVCDPIAVIEAGRSQAKFWCEIAARTLAHAAGAVGWPARVITISETGYRWDHAATELWSNEFDKWFVVDADFNVVFEVDGVPLSGWEMVHDGPRLAREGKLQERRFAPRKSGLTPTDFVELYQYVHIDLRTDWCSRKLKRGSPAGGDRSTWWTARPDRGPSFGPSLRIDRKEIFDWPVNHVTLGIDETDDRRQRLRIVAYTPSLSHFEYRFDQGAWRRAGASDRPPIDERHHVVEVRVVTQRGDRGPSSRTFLQGNGPRAAEDVSKIAVVQRAE
jgi:hypothetical protein